MENIYYTRKKKEKGRTREFVREGGREEGKSKKREKGREREIKRV